MNRFKTLLLREWLQHRFGWAMMVLIPIALAVVLGTFGTIDIEPGKRTPTPEQLPLIIAMASLAGTAVVVGLIACVASVFTVAGLARRDHGDRSVEYWLSLPVDHASTFAAPLLVHLLIVPAAALLAGWLGGWLISLVLVTRFDSLSAWFALPWGTLTVASLALIGRLIAGLPLALLWLSPVILLTVLLYAWFRRWGLVILAVLLAIGNLRFEWLLGRPLFTQWIAALFEHAGRALVFPHKPAFVIKSDEHVPMALNAAPSWALENFGMSVNALASPLLLVALLLAAGFFWALVDWRRRGASTGS